jgi:hypothetical protein
MSDDLVAFLRARLTDDERAAKAAPDGPWGVAEARQEGPWTVLGAFTPHERFNTASDTREITVRREQIAGADLGAGGVRTRAAAEHIARHDPARVLADVEAKRELVKLHGRAVLRAGGGAQYFDTETVCRSCEPNYQFRELSWPCTTLRLLALPYADHPDYRDEWRP